MNERKLERRYRQEAQMFSADERAEIVEDLMSVYEAVRLFLMCCTHPITQEDLGDYPMPQMKMRTAVEDECHIRVRARVFRDFCEGEKTKSSRQHARETFNQTGVPTNEDTTTKEANTRHVVGTGRG
jgi:hypothetical protein